MTNEQYEAIGALEYAIRKVRQCGATKFCTDDTELLSDLQSWIRESMDTEDVEEGA